MDESFALHASTLDILKEEIATIAKVRDVGADTSISQDLGLDSLAVMNFVMALEDRFDVSIPMDRIVDVETVGDLASVIETLRRDRTTP